MTTVHSSDKPGTPPTLPLVTVQLCEGLDSSTASRVSERLEEALRLRPHRLVLDLSGCDFLDATGVSALVRAHRAARWQDTSLVLLHPSPRLRRVLALTGLLDVFTIEPEVAS